MYKHIKMNKKSLEQSKKKLHKKNLFTVLNLHLPFFHKKLTAQFKE